MAMMFMSVSDERFFKSENSQMAKRPDTQDNGLKTCTRLEMLRYLNRVLDRNKPLFLFNSKTSHIDTFNDTSTPSFSVIALLESN